MHRRYPGEPFGGSPNSPAVVNAPFNHFHTRLLFNPLLLYLSWSTAFPGARQPVSDSISDRRAAWQLASSLLTPDGETVYFKEAGEPDSAIRPHPVPEEQLRMAYA